MANKKPTGRPSSTRYTPEFRADSVALWRRSGKTLAEVARELGISDVTLGTWVKDTERSAPMDDKEKSDREEAARLRKEIKDLKEEIEILKRFTAYWVKEGK